jgi:hypothetical protein
MDEVQNGPQISVWTSSSNAVALCCVVLENRVCASLLALKVANAGSIQNTKRGNS